TAVFVDFLRSFITYLLQQRARPLGDYYGWLVSLDLFPDYFFKILQVEGIGYPHPFYPNCLCQQFKVDLFRRFALDGEASGGIMLVSRHTRDRVIQDYHGGTALVVNNVYQPGDADRKSARL